MTTRYKRPDRKNASSILQAAERDMDFTLSLKLTEQSTSTIVRNIYECFRMLGDSLMVSRGLESDDHIAPIRELMKLKINTPRPINLLDNMRILRHNINYYGYSPTILEAEDAVSFAKACFWMILKAVKSGIE